MYKYSSEQNSAEDGFHIIRFAREGIYTKKVKENRVSRVRFEEVRQTIAKARKARPLEELLRGDAILYDRETGFLSKRSFERKFKYELTRAKRYKRPLSLAVISIDDFALIGKQYGDLCIEDCFRAMTRAISQVVRDVDVPARLERDQVVVLFPETYSSRATICGARLCEKIIKEIINDKLRFLQVTASVGVVSFPTHGREGDELLNKAVEFLQCAQERGGNQAYTE
jgi:diguanylate cyclase (GGDEF)-like protein